MSLKDELKKFEATVTTDMLQNMRVMVGDFQIAAKHFGTVIAPIGNLLEKLEKKEWIVIKNPAHPANQPATDANQNTGSTAPEAPAPAAPVAPTTGETNPDGATPSGETK